MNGIDNPPQYPKGSNKYRAPKNIIVETAAVVILFLDLPTKISNITPSSTLIKTPTRLCPSS